MTHLDQQETSKDYKTPPKLWNNFISWFSVQSFFWLSIIKWSRQACKDNDTLGSGVVYVHDSKLHMK